MNLLKCLVLLIGISISTSSVFADSDGIFCVSKNYIAIQAKGIYIPAKEDAWIVIPYSKNGIGKKQVIPVSDSKHKEFNCKDSDNIIKTGQLPYIKKSEAINLHTINKTEFINVLMTLHSDNQFEGDGGGDGGLIFHYFSLSLVHIKNYETLYNSELLASGLRLETIH